MPRRDGGANPPVCASSPIRAPGRGRSPPPGRIEAETVPDGTNRRRERQEMLAHIRNRAGMVAMAEEVVHQVPQAIAASMILHPTCLESGILAVISEDDQFLLRGG